MSSTSETMPSDVYVFPASFAQQRLWFLDQLHPDQAVYNIPSAIRLRGQLEIPCLQVALQSLVDRHETLRTTFEMDGLELMQCIQSEHSFVLDVISLHDLPFAEREQRIVEIATSEARHPFALQHGPLLRAKLLAIAENDHVLLITMHHIVSDGWSLGVFTKEMSAFYNASVAGTSAELPKLEIQYVDYDIYQREWLAGEHHETQMEYWKQQLAGELPILQLPTDRKRPAMQSYRGASQRFELSKDTVDELKRVAAQRGCTLFMFLLATYQVLLHRVSGQQEMIVGTPVAGRTLPEVEGLIGFFVNNLTLRADFSEDLLFSEFVEQVSKTTIAAFSHQDTPFEKVVEALQPNRSMSHTPLFQTMFVLQPSPLTQLRMVGLETELLTIESGIAKFDLTFDLTESETGILGRVEYCTDLYEQATIERMIGHFQSLLHAILTNPEQRVARLPLLTEQERQQLLSGWHQATPLPISNDRCLHERFEEQANHYPERIAVTCQEESLTYAELNQRANRLAHYLQQLGVRQGHRVGICVERSLEIPVAILGVLKAGGTYIPLDPNYPQERLTILIQDAEISLLLTQQHLLEHLPDHDVQTLCLDSAHDRKQMALQPPTNLNGIVTPKDLAYMIYTSGSTGKPKGVMVTHENVMRLFTSTEARFAFHEEDVWTLFHSFAFDFSVWEIWGALLYGGRLVVVPHMISRSPEAFYELLVQEEITMLNQTPSAFRQLMQAEEARGVSDRLRLRHVIFGGEALELSSLIPWFERHGEQTPQLVNMYGITETTVHVTYRPLTFADAKVGTGSLIGRPIPNLELYLLDSEQQLVPVGVPGELYVGGAGVAQGYWKRPELTAERFIKHPFSTDPHARLYRTGDIGRRLSDGDIEYLGRIDDQVKIRGFRIELGEIESAICQHPLVRQALVLIRPLGTSEQEVVAYVVPTAMSDVNVLTLREHVQRVLPTHMIPSAFVLLSEFPLTAHGKVDKKALPHPTVERSDRAEYIAPQNEIEQIISEIWQEVLGVTRVGIHDNFFDLGGHSMKIVQVHRLLQERLQEEVTVVDVFQYPTISALASHLRQETQEEAVDKGQQRAERRKRALLATTQDGHSSHDIAIIGMAGRFPGANDVDQFWENLYEGVDSITFLTDDQLLAAGVEPELLRHPDYVRAASLLPDVECFDAAFFGYSPREAEIMDPQQRVFLETAWSAMEHAGYDTEAIDDAVGVFAGSALNQYILYNIAPNKGLTDSLGDFLIAIGNDKDFLATRTSYKLNLRGPSVNVQTACSTSLVAVHMACQSLLREECEMALAGGVTVLVPQEKGYVYAEGSPASPDGRCRAFDERAQGKITGSGVGVIVLKRLEDAFADGDTIHAVIKGTAINNDGAEKVGFTTPGVDGQADVITEALAVAGVNPETVTYVEAHGNATPMGDPIEVQALTQAFRKGTSHTKYCALGSVKTNVGHLGSAAGITGLIKTVLALKHKTLPASLHFEKPNPKIDFANSPFFVNSERRAWETAGVPRRAGISSFGLGGTNAHVILEEAPTPPAPSASDSWQLLLLSGQTAERLEVATDRLASHLQANADQDIANVAYTLQIGRRPFSHRRALVVNTRDAAVQSLEQRDPKHLLTSVSDDLQRHVAFLFTGTGEQYVRMAAGLYEQELHFQQVVDHCCDVLKPLLEQDLRDLLFPAPSDKDSTQGTGGFDLRKLLGRANSDNETQDELSRTEYAHAALFMIEYAMASTLMRWGIQPKGMIGHSLGEYVAACLAGVFTLEEAMTLVVKRAQLIETLPQGKMLAIPLPEAAVRELLSEGLFLATVNAPNHCVVSGLPEAISQLEARLHEQNIAAIVVRANHAFHSPLLTPIAEEFARLVRSFAPKAPSLPFISNVTGTWITTEQATTPDYWVQHLCQTVRFGDGLRTMCQDKQLVLLEMGPGQTLCSFALMADEQPGRIVLPTLRNRFDARSDLQVLLQTVGQLWLCGAPIDFAALHVPQRRQRVPLPTYPFERQRYWINPVQAQNTVSSYTNVKRVDTILETALPLYRPMWKRQPVSINLQGHPPLPLTEESWLLFTEGHVGDALAGFARSQGRHVMLVRSGEQFIDHGNCTYTIPAHDANSYVTLLQHVHDTAMPLTKIVHCWSLTPSDVPIVETHDWHSWQTEQTHGYHSLHLLTQAIAGATSKPLHIEVISNHLFDIEETGSIFVEKTPLIAACKIIPQEYADLTVRLFDIQVPEQDSAMERLLTQLQTRFDSPLTERTLVCRSRHTWVQTYDQVLEDAIPTSASSRSECGVYLLVGDNPIALSLAKYLMKQGAAQVLVAVPAQQQNAFRSTELVHLHQNNANLQVIEIDQSQHDALDWVTLLKEVDARKVNLEGVIDARPLLSNVFSPISTTRDTAVQGQIQTRIQETYALDQALVMGVQRPSFVLLLSSISAVLGGIERSAQATTACFLSAFAEQRSTLQETAWSTLQWDPRIEDIEDRLWEHVVRDVPEGGDFVLSMNVQESVKRWINTPVSPVIDAEQANETKMGNPRPNLPVSYVPATNETETLIIQMWEELLGVQPIGIHDPFLQVGGNSLLGTQLVSRLRNTFQIELPLRALFEADTVAELALFIEDILIAELEALEKMEE